MRLNLIAKSKNRIGYIPDWVKVSYKNENNENMEITLDVQGEINYDNDKLDCCIKGELIPWVLIHCNFGEEVDLYEKENIQKEYEKKIREILLGATEITVGLYPANDDEKTFQMAEEDELSIGNGTYEVYDTEKDKFSVVHFLFNTELNI